MNERFEQPFILCSLFSIIWHYSTIFFRVGKSRILLLLNSLLFSLNGTDNFDQQQKLKPESTLFILSFFFQQILRAQTREIFVIWTWDFKWDSFRWVICSAPYDGKMGAINATVVLTKKNIPLVLRIWYFCHSFLWTFTIKRQYINIDDPYSNTCILKFPKLFNYFHLNFDANVLAKMNVYVSQKCERRMHMYTVYLQLKC